MDPNPENLEDYGRVFGQLHQVLTAEDIGQARALLDTHGTEINAVVCELLPTDHPLSGFHDETVVAQPEFAKRFIFLAPPGPLAGIAKAKNLNLFHKPIRPAVLLAEIFKIPTQAPDSGPY